MDSKNGSTLTVQVCPHYNLYSFNVSDFLRSVLEQCHRVDLKKSDNQR